MAKTKPKPDERTFTAELYLERNHNDRYTFVVDVGEYNLLQTDSVMHKLFRGIARWFRRPTLNQWVTRQRIRMTIEVLPDENPKTPPSG